VKARQRQVEADAEATLDLVNNKLQIGDMSLVIGSQDPAEPNINITHENLFIGSQETTEPSINLTHGNVFIGLNSTAASTAVNSIAIGHNSTVSGNNSIAIGDVVAENKQIRIGGSQLDIKLGALNINITLDENYAPTLNFSGVSDPDDGSGPYVLNTLAIGGNTITFDGSTVYFRNTSGDEGTLSLH
jgi:hypothetical protein